MPLAGSLELVAGLSAADRDAMFALMDRHFAGVGRDAFDADLAEKRWVIVVRDPGRGRPCGFSTQTVLAGEADGRPFRALFSGDTIVDRAHWGDPGLARLWGRLALALMDRHAGEELVWFLLSQGYKTYRFLPLYFREFHPRPGVPTPARAAAVVRSLASARYPGRFDAAAGVVRGGPGQYRLREGVAELTAARLRDEAVRFFAAANPGHGSGDELCCLAPLTRANFTPAAWRAIGADSPPLELP